MGPRGGNDWGRRARFAALGRAPRRTPGEAGLLGPGSNPDCASKSLRPRKRVTSHFEKGARDVQP